MMKFSRRVAVVKLLCKNDLHSRNIIGLNDVSSKKHIFELITKVSQEIK